MEDIEYKNFLNFLKNKVSPPELTTNKSMSRISSIIQQIIFPDVVKDHKEIFDIRSELCQSESLDSTIVQHDQILLVSLYLLLNISENIILEVKMLKKGLISILVNLLVRVNLELLIICVCFLKKLSIFVENIEQMLKQNVIHQLQDVFSNNCDPVKQMSLRLLSNLSFDRYFQEIIANDKIMVYLLQDLIISSEKSTLFAILYHTSIQLQNFVHFENSNILVLFKQWIHDIAVTDIDILFLALLVNLLQSSTIALFFLDIYTIDFIFCRSFDAQLHGANLLKIVSTGMHHKQCCRILKSHQIVKLIEHLPVCVNRDLIIEIFRILNSVPYAQYQICKLEICFDIKIYLLQNLLCYQDVEDDLLLEYIMYTGVFAINHESAIFLCKEGAVNILITILKDRQEDDEFVLQILYIFYLILFHSTTNDSIIYDPQMPSYISELYNDQNLLIASYSNEALNLLFCHDSGYANQILIERFNLYNFQWLDSLEGDLQNKRNETSLQNLHLLHSTTFL